VALLSFSTTRVRAGTVALWLFDEQVGVYPSSVLNDAGPHSYFLILGRGGELVPGKFGDALQPMKPVPFDPHFKPGLATAVRDGLEAPKAMPGRTVVPLSWQTATFAAAFLNGDQHLRRKPFPHPTSEPLNLGARDFTVEFWLKPGGSEVNEGTVFEIGSGPRGENNLVTRFSFDPVQATFEFFNQPSQTNAVLMSDRAALNSGEWVHCAVVYDSAKGELRHYLNGHLESTIAAKLKPLPVGDEDYWSIGRDGLWQHPLAGALDEMRISDEAIYRADFTVPSSFARLHNGERKTHAPLAGPPLLFGPVNDPSKVVDLGSRRHVFLDDALLDTRQHVAFMPHPARVAEAVLKGSGWLSVVDAGPHDIRLYVNGPDNSVAVFTSPDGVHFTAPDLGRIFKGKNNITLTDPATVGTVFIDPNGRDDERWKLVSGLRDRGGVFTYTSADGFNWKRNEAASLPFWAGSAVNVFYDDQRQLYVIHNRSDYYTMPGDGGNDRKSVLTEVSDLLKPWPFKPVTEADTRAATARGVSTSAGELDPWWMDNGPLAPGGFGLEYPIAFEADPKLDPPGTDVYNTRAQKYPWAEDAYVAFPLLFFHYYGTGPAQRQILASPDEKRGTGLVETQLAVSRDGRHWTRYPRPAYVGIGMVDGFQMRRPYTGYGMVRRGREIWQYVYGRSSYHDPYEKAPMPDAIFRIVQRVDGFVSVDGAYTGGEFTTKPLRFTGSRLVLNIDTDAAGYAQVGFVDESGQPIPGFGVDNCIYINGDEINYLVEWMNPKLERTNDVSALASRTVRLVVRLHGASLYALQFTDFK